jgi:hypothetical protein
MKANELDEAIRAARCVAAIREELYPEDDSAADWNGGDICQEVDGILRRFGFGPTGEETDKDEEL